jgi:hypothetical protein
MIYHGTNSQKMSDKNWLLVCQNDNVDCDRSVPLCKIQQFVNPPHNNQLDCWFEKLIPEHIKVTISTGFGFAAGQIA